MMLLACWRKLWALRDQRQRREAGELVSSAEDVEGILKSSSSQGSTNVTVVDAAVDVLVDLGEDGEQPVSVPKAGIKSCNDLRAAIAKATLSKVGKKRTPQQWRKKQERGGRQDGLASAMTLSLTFDNQIDEPSTEALTDRTPIEYVLQANCIVAMPT